MAVACSGASDPGASELTWIRRDCATSISALPGKGGPQLSSCARGGMVKICTEEQFKDREARQIIGIHMRRLFMGELANAIVTFTCEPEVETQPIA